MFRGVISHAPRFLRSTLPLSRTVLVSRAVFSPQKSVFRPSLAHYSSSTSDGPAKVTPEYMIAFTCTKCNTRSSHTFSKQAYHHGTVLVQCPGCKNRHLIADHLKIFDDKRVTLEDILKQKGESVLLAVGDLAFEDIPDKLKKTLGPYVKDAPVEHQEKDDGVKELPEGK